MDKHFLAPRVSRREEKLRANRFFLLFSSRGETRGGRKALSAAASNYTPVDKRVEPNNLQFVFSGLDTLQNREQWFPSVNYGTVTDDGKISNPTSGPYAGKTIVTLTTEAKYWQIANPDPAAGQIGAYVSGPGIPPGTVVAAQGDTKSLILILSNHATDSGGKDVPLTFTGQPPANPIRDSGFETPALTGKPPGTPWTFGPGSGIAGNGSSLTALNAPVAGTYTLSFNAAQRQDGQTVDHQTIAILVDDKKVGEITPSGANYAAYSVSFTVAAGSHTITLEGTVPPEGGNPRPSRGRSVGGGGATAFIDAVTLTVKPTQPGDPFSGLNL
jgi:hypothetical protein